MHGPATSGWLLVVLCAVTGAYCLVWMPRCSGTARAATGGEALMGFGMAAMAVPAAVFTPPPWHWVVYAAVFGAAALRATWPVRDCGRHAHHLVGCLAMVYMAAAMASGGGHGTHAGGGVPLLTGALFLYFTVYVLRSGTRLLSLAPSGGGTVPVPVSPVPRTAGPSLVPACRVSMAIAMLAMLLTL
ncbi:DUF5134 domain-containing protein [Streptomyces peucetius]|uniref:DUF5134 domain-containing protein n=1 Tax=Streptomyces peucetius TaxID=1950 RepID=A0ABY6I4T5_STRPE|nr:DUF5134 domain-containing protein [Streptomyces peucetius]UYQ60760.1 DUF5134 domain-containing protein [Streptomyces peucetius]